MIPMLIPKNICVDTGNYKGWNRGAVLVSLLPLFPSSPDPSFNYYSLDRELAPKIYDRVLVSEAFQIFRNHIPLVAAAWSFTAFLSRLKALFSAPTKPELSVLANRRWKGVRTAGERSWEVKRWEVRSIVRWGNIVLVCG